MALRSNRHLATLCSATALLLRGRLVDKAPGARLLIKARALHSDAHRRSRIYGRNRIPHSNLRQVLAPRLGPYMAERGGFEPSVPLEVALAEFGPSLAHYSARIKASMLGEDLFAWGSALLRISPVPFVRQADARNLGDVEHEMKVWSSNLPFLGGQSSKALAERPPVAHRTFCRNDFPR